MGACDFSAVFSEICNSIIGGENISQVEIYSSLFDSYYRTHSDEFFHLDKSDINKRKQGKLNAHAGVMAYYCHNTAALVSDIATNIIPLLSDKYALRDTFVNMVMCDSCSEEKKADTLSETDDLPLFFANVILHSFGHNSVPKNASPDISDRIISSVPNPCKYFSGREKELSALDEMLKAHDKIFVYGIGCIGKSEFVKKYISTYKKEYANILYMTYSTSLRNTIALPDFSDDKTSDSVETRFTRHKAFLKHLKSDSLIVIDNFDILPDMDEHLEEILSYNCKIIFTTRNHFDDEYNVFELTEMDTDTLMLIAKSINIEESADMLSRLFAAVHYHTLSCELILKLLQKSAYTSDELLEHLLNDHVKLDISAKIRRTNKASTTYYGHIQILFDLISLSAEQKDALRILTLIPVSGIGDKYFCKLTATKNINPIIELDEMGLIRYADHNISIHPLIAETAAAELVPDMDKCRFFLNSVSSGSLFMIDDITNRIRSRILLPIADNVIEYAQHNDTHYYVDFLISMSTYAQVFEDSFHLGNFISEIDQYIDESYSYSAQAVHLMSKAAFCMLSDKNVSKAIEYTSKAEKYLPNDILENDATLAFNIYNNLLCFFIESNGPDKAEKYLSKAIKLIDKLPYESNDQLVLLRNISEYYRIRKDFSSAAKFAKIEIQIYIDRRILSYDYAYALIRTAKIYTEWGKPDKAKYCSDHANVVLSCLGDNVVKMIENGGND